MSIGTASAQTTQAPGGAEWSHSATTRASVREKAVTGTFWALGAHVSQQVVRLVSNVTMTHFLKPEAFGIMQLVNVVLRGLQMMSDVGVGPSIVQHERGKDPVFLQTAWTIQFMRGTIVALIGVALALPAEWFFHQPGLASYLAVAAAFSIIGGLVSTSVYTATRDLNVKLLTIVDFTTSVVTLLAMVILAWQLQNVWALVLGGAISGVVRVVLSHTVLPGVRHRFRWEKDARQELFDYGRWIFLSTLLTFLALQADRLLLPKLVPDMQLFGVFGIALQLALLPVEIAQGLASSIIMPMYSRLKQGGKLPSGVFAQVAFLTSTMGGLVVAGMIGAGPGFIRTFFDRDYHDAAILIVILGALAWSRVLQNNAGAALLALGKPKGNAISNAIKLVGMLLLMPLGFVIATSYFTSTAFNGLVGAVVGLTLSDLAKYIVLVRDASREGLSPMRADLKATLFLGITATMILGVQWWLRSIHTPPYAEMIACGLLAIGFYLGSLVKCYEMVRPSLNIGPFRSEVSRDHAVMKPMRALRINFIMPPPDLSGGIKSNRLIAEAMVRRGHTVHILYPAAVQPWPPPWRVRTIAKKLRAEMRLLGKPRHHLLKSTATIVPVVGLEVQANEVPDADVTIGTWWRTMEWVAGYPESKGLKAYFVRAHELHGGDPKRVAATYRLPAKKLVISNALRRVMRDEYGDPDAALIHNGVDRRQFGAPPRGKQSQPTVGIQYNATSFKDMPTGLEALRLVKQELPDLHVVAFGSEPVREGHAFPPGTDYYLRPQQQLIPDLYRQCDCWVICSVDEGFGMPGLESAACRCPVVSTRSGGPEDYVVDGVTGYLVRVRDPRALADAILRVLRLSDAEWRAMSEASERKSREFDWDLSAEKLEKVLMEELEKRERGGRHQAKGGTIQACSGTG